MHLICIRWTALLAWLVACYDKLQAVAVFGGLGESAVCQGLDGVLLMISISDIVNHNVLIFMSLTDFHIVTMNVVDD